ncbi:MAG: hypothetical protein AAF657_34170 [Acidobacteriota bacterium]
MINPWTRRRTILTALFAVLALAATSALFLPRAEAVGCGESHDGSTQMGQWLVTQAALDRDSQNACSLGEHCKEWCLTGCGSVFPTGQFDCFPQ